MLDELEQCVLAHLNQLTTNAEGNISNLSLLIGKLGRRGVKQVAQGHVTSKL